MKQAYTTRSSNCSMEMFKHKRAKDGKTSAFNQMTGLKK